VTMVEDQSLASGGLHAVPVELCCDAVGGLAGEALTEDVLDHFGLALQQLALCRPLADPAVGDATLDLAVLRAREVHTSGAARGVLGGLQRHHAHDAGHVPVAVVDQVHVAAGGSQDRSLHVLDDVDQVFQVPGPTDQAVEVVEDHAVDDAAGQVCQESSELRAEHDPVDRAVRADNLALLEGGGVVLLVDLGEVGPSQPSPSVVRVLELAVDAGLQAEPVVGDAQVRPRALGDVGGEVVVEVEGDLAPASLRRDFEVLPEGESGGGHGGVGSCGRVGPALDSPSDFAAWSRR